MNPWKWKCFWFSPQKTKDDPCIKHPETESGIGSSATLEVETYSISSLPCHINPKKSFIQKRLTKSSENIPQQDYKGDNLARTFENPFFENNGIPVVIKRKIRLIMIGNHEVGKSSVSLNTFSDVLCELSLVNHIHMCKVENYYYDINIVDMGSDVAKLARVSSFEDHINGIVFVYSIDNPKSLDDLFNARDLICDTVDSIRITIQISNGYR
uniref:Ras family protein n=1 Tax=Heterorhabditis bacteriophora TaxID=37862 RepID=A0A1I7XE69_HETBA